MSPTLHDYPRLVGDIGGTNARFGWLAAPGAAMADVRGLACAEHASLQAAMRAYLGQRRARQCAIGIANPVLGDEVRMTNRDWSFSIEALRRAMGFDRLRVINDFTALALALPLLPAEHMRQVGGGAAVAGAAIGLIGPGTGLGVSGLVAGGGGLMVPLSGEGGHASLSAHTEDEWQVVQRLQQRHGHASAERALSGPGLSNLYAALADWRGIAGLASPTAAAITEHALAGSDELAVQALAMFCALLGSTAGDLALTLGARGGIYIGGGIVPRLGHWFDSSPFRARFEAKGRFHAYLEAVPTYVIDAPTSPALLGAAQAFDLP